MKEIDPETGCEIIEQIPTSKLKESDLSPEEWLVLEELLVIMDDEFRLLTEFELQQKVTIQNVNLQKILQLAQFDRLISNITGSNPVQWQLTTRGFGMEREIQMEYLQGTEDYHSNLQSYKDLIQEHIQLLELFEHSSKNSPKKIPNEILQEKKSKENPLWLVYPQLFELLEKGLLSHAYFEKGFKYFYANAWTKKVLMRIREFKLTWDQLNTYQRSLLQFIKNTTELNPASLMEIKQLNIQYQIEEGKEWEYWEPLLWANLMEESDLSVKEELGFYILADGLALLKNNIPK
jgi:hypothetical protein